MESPVTAPNVVTAEQWRAERIALLQKEKALTRAQDQLSAERRRLPMVKVAKSYRFDGPEGEASLLDLFLGQRQLIVYHFMFDPSWDEGCPGCTGFVEALGNLDELADRQTSFVLVSRAPREKLVPYAGKYGWPWKWYSSFGSDFNEDFQATINPESGATEYNFKDTAAERRADGSRISGEQPGISVFFQVQSEVFHTYSTYQRGVEGATDSYSLLDLTPFGRQEDWEDSPAGWPQRPTYG